MTNPSPAASLADACLPFLEWTERRLQEKSTWIGIAGWLCTLGFAGFASQITSHLALILAIAGILNTGLITTSTKPRAPELLVSSPMSVVQAAIAKAPTLLVAPPRPVPAALPAPAPRPVPTSTTTEGNDMSLITVARKLFGVIAVAVAPTWSKAIANSLAQSEAVLVPLLGDDAKQLCEDQLSTSLTGFQKLAAAVSDLAKIAQDKGIKADEMVLTVIVAKAYAQVKANAPELIDTAIETGISAAAGPAVAALTAPVVESAVAAGAAATGLTPAPAVA